MEPAGTVAPPAGLPERGRLQPPARLPGALELSPTCHARSGLSVPGILSTQVLQEFYVNATRKIRKPLTKPEARTLVDT